MPLPIHLYYKNGTKYVLLHDWACFFADLGWDIARAKNPEKHLVVALVLPTRAYAAALIATGIVLSRSAELSAGKTTAEEHFKELCQLPPGTEVFIIEGNKKKRGAIQPYKGPPYDIEPRIGVALPGEKGGPMVRFLPCSMCLKIEVAGDGTERSSLRAAGRETIFHNLDFVNCLVQHMNIWEFGGRSQLECLVLGDIGVFRREVTEKALAVESLLSGFAGGTLQDFLRVHKFLGNKPYRSDVLPIRGKKPPTSAAGTTPPIVIFDGARGFLKWRDSWRGSNWIVILDRTDPDFIPASCYINQETLHRDSGGPPVEFSPPPAGIELIVYQEAQ